jgi:hypothetical protein
MARPVRSISARGRPVRGRTIDRGEEVRGAHPAGAEAMTSLPPGASTPRASSVSRP